MWVVAGVGRVLPQAMWDAMTVRLDDGDDEPWDRVEELVPADLFTAGVGPDGPVDVSELLGHSTCPVAAELLRAAG